MVREADAVVTRHLGPAPRTVPDLVQIASRVMEQVNSHNPDAVFVDGTGIGWGRARSTETARLPNLVGVDFGARADRATGPRSAASTKRS
ncbi:MAG: hypothetical protein QOJ15_8831 [Bradyrhizobium sp.]|jgi:hypothetical protein|nr:hypothetical protein [Bradyrhizobium sp.]